MNLADFFSTKYLFDPAPPRESRLYLPLLIVFSLLLILSLVVKFMPAKITNLSRRYFLSFLVPSILGFLYLFGRYERLPWLGARIYLIVIVIVLMVWLAINSIWALRFLPKYSREQMINEKYDKYLPKPKKGRCKK